MMTFDTDLSKAVREYQAANRVTQSELAAQLGILQPSLAQRLNGRTRWTINDLINLSLVGVEIPEFPKADATGTKPIL